MILGSDLLRLRARHPESTHRGPLSMRAPHANRITRLAISRCSLAACCTCAYRDATERRMNLMPSLSGDTIN
jgi:hypothetical protein